MDFNTVLKKLQEALTPEQQKQADIKKKAIAAAKAKNPALANTSDDELDYDAATNTVKKLKLNSMDLNKVKNVKVKI